MSLAEAIETTQIHSVAGLNGDHTALAHVLYQERLLSYHLGCGADRWRPRADAGRGVAGLRWCALPAHLPKFRRHALEVLRQPLEDGVYMIQFRGRLDLIALAALAERRETATRTSAPRLAFATLRGLAGI